MRWVPKNVSLILVCPWYRLLTSNQPDSLSASGADMVYAQAVFAVIGALALEQGGAVANRIAKEKILEPLGLKSTGSQPVGLR